MASPCFGKPYVFSDLYHYTCISNLTAAWPSHILHNHPIVEEQYHTYIRYLTFKAAILSSWKYTCSLELCWRSVDIREYQCQGRNGLNFFGHGLHYWESDYLLGFLYPYREWFDALAHHFWSDGKNAVIEDALVSWNFLLVSQKSSIFFIWGWKSGNSRNAVFLQGGRA